jgi:RecA-family ATPase
MRLKIMTKNNNQYNPEAVRLALKYQAANDQIKKEFNELLFHPENLPKQDPNGGQNIKTEWTVNELYDTDFPDPDWLVKELIPTGLVSLAGHPKIGKSWMALQLAVSVASGSKFLDLDVTQGKVLYLAFEDPAKRLKMRNMQMGTKRNTPVTFKTEYSLLTEGGLDDLYIDIEDGDYKLVIIDTFGRSIGLIEIRDYSDNVFALSPLQKLAQRKGITILLIDHHSKLGSSNPITDLIGSIGKAGTFDTLLGLYRERGKAGAKLISIGRDQEDKDIAVEWDTVNYSWEFMGDTASVFKNEVLATMRVLAGMGELPTTTAIAERMDATPGNVSRAISDLVAAGLARRLPKQGRQQPYEAV